jgi:membrane-associated protease RseP (regulator of RpoE activity)
MGLLGMDVLRSCRIFIDFSHQRLRFLEENAPMPSTGGTVLHLQSGKDDCPRVMTRFGDWPNTTILLDTGTTLNGSVTGVLLDSAVRHQGALLGWSSSFTASGYWRERRIKLTQPLEFAGVTHSDVVFEEGSVNTLGLIFLSSYDTFIDFPNGKVMLIPRWHDAPQQGSYEPGFGLAFQNGKAIILDLRSFWFGLTTGLVPGDELVAIGGKRVADFELWKVRLMLTSSEAQSVSLTVRRRGRLIQVPLTLAKPEW